MKITKRREDNAWRLIIDGKPSRLIISKGPAPRYREPQEYDLSLDDTDQTFLFTANSVGRVVGIIEHLAQELQP